MTENSTAFLPRLSVSTWSLHRTLGQPAFYGVEQGRHIPVETHGRGALSLLELPARLAKFDIYTLEICHFHLPRLEKAYLAELRSALQESGIELFSLLIDDGDITDPSNGARDLAWISSWLEIAGSLGAKRVRVIAGKAIPTPEAMEVSVQGMRQLIVQAQEHGLRLMTENWFGLLSTPANVLELFDQLEGNVGLCLDFGNWKGPEKYEGFKVIAPLAESCHTKAQSPSPYVIDHDDYVRCLDITRAASFKGPYTLIYDGPGSDEWRGLDLEREIVRPYLQ